MSEAASKSFELPLDSLEYRVNPYPAYDGLLAAGGFWQHPDTGTVYIAHYKDVLAVLRDWRRELRSRVAHWTGQYPFVIDEVLQGMILRARELRLRVCYSERETVQDAAIVLTMHTMRHIRGTYREYHR